MQGDRAGRAVPPAEQMFGFAVSRCAIVMQAALLQRFRDAGHTVTPEQFAILNLLQGAPALTQSEIAERTIRDRTTVTRLIDGVARRGWVVRRQDESDRRVWRADLTAEGRRIADALRRIAAGLIEDAVAGIPAKDRQVTMATLAQVSANLGG